jgi:hypothetical protein
MVSVPTFDFLASSSRRSWGCCPWLARRRPARRSRRARPGAHAALAVYSPPAAASRSRPNGRSNRPVEHWLVQRTRLDTSLQPPHADAARATRTSRPRSLNRPHRGIERIRTASSPVKRSPTSTAQLRSSGSSSRPRAHRRHHSTSARLACLFEALPAPRSVSCALSSSVWRSGFVRDAKLTPSCAGRRCLLCARSPIAHSRRSGEARGVGV